LLIFVPVPDVMCTMCWKFYTPLIFCSAEHMSWYTSCKTDKCFKNYSNLYSVEVQVGWHQVMN